MKETTCCFFGHRTIHETEELRAGVTAAIERLITEEHVDTFLFGSKSQFNTLCHQLVTDLKEKYPHIRRIYVRAEFPDLRDDFIEYLLQSYEDTYYPEKIRGAGKAAYVERNYEMIDNSAFCIVYYDAFQAPTTRKSGTKIALDYAIKKNLSLCLFP